MFSRMPVKKMYAYVGSALAVLFCLMLLLGCKDTLAIFASLENEEKIETSNFPDQASIFGMAKLQGRYYAATGARLWDRKTSDSNWDKTNLLHGYSRVKQLVQAAVDTTIYFIAYKESDRGVSEQALFRITTGGMERVRTENSLARIFITPRGTLFACLKNGENYEYYRDYEKATPKSLVNANNVDGIILDVDEFNGSTKYVLTQRGLFTVTGTTLTVVTIDGNAGRGYMTGLLSYDSNADGTKDTLVVSNKNYVWETKDGTAWTSYKVDSEATFFTDFLYIKQRAFTGLLVGTRNYLPGIGSSQGYRELRTESKDFKTPEGNKYTSGALHKADVLGFFLDEAENVFFVLTKGSGLWKGTYSNTRSIDWFLE